MGGIAKGLPLTMVYTRDGALATGEKAIVKAGGLGDATPFASWCSGVRPEYRGGSSVWWRLSVLRQTGNC